MLVDSVEVHMDEFAASFDSPSFNTLKRRFLINNQLKTIGRSSPTGLINLISCSVARA